jgi:hypothetical protein
MDHLADRHEPPVVLGPYGNHCIRVFHHVVTCDETMLHIIYEKQTPVLLLPKNEQ